MRIGSRNQVLGCLGCLGVFSILVVIQLPNMWAQRNAMRAGEGSRTLRAMATAHQAKPEVTAFAFELGTGGDAGWKTLGLPEDSKWHSYEAWVDTRGRLWMTAIGNLDRDEPMDEWEWPGPVASPTQLRSDFLNEWKDLYYLQRPARFPKEGPNPVLSHDERMAIARERAWENGSLNARWTVEDIGDAETRHKMKTGAWRPFAVGDTATLFQLVDRASGSHRYAAFDSGDTLVVEATSNLDDDPCLDRWQMRSPRERTATRVENDLTGPCDMPATPAPDAQPGPTRAPRERKSRPPR